MGTIRSRTDASARRTAPGLALIVAAVSLVVGLAACSGATSSPRTAATATTQPATTTTEAPLTAGRQLSVYVPNTGDCYDKRTAGDPVTPTVVFLLLPCTLPHQNEVFATVDYPDPNFPSGVGVLEQYAKQHCVTSFAAYVGKPYETSSYDIGYEIPTAASWGNGIRHVIGCLVVAPNGKRTATSARASGK